MRIDASRIAVVIGAAICFFLSAFLALALLSIDRRGPRDISCETKLSLLYQKLRLYEDGLRGSNVELSWDEELYNSTYSNPSRRLKTEEEICEMLKNSLFWTKPNHDNECRLSLMFCDGAYFPQVPRPKLRDLSPDVAIAIVVDGSRAHECINNFLFRQERMSDSSQKVQAILFADGSVWKLRAPCSPMILSSLVEVGNQKKRSRSEILAPFGISVISRP